MTNKIFGRRTYKADQKASLSRNIDVGDAAFCDQQVRRAGLFMESGELKEAESCLLLGLDRVPGHPECRAYYAICLAAQKSKFLTAEKLAKTVLRDHPNDPTAWYALGRVNLLGGRRSQAFSNFQKARSVSGNDAAVEVLIKQEDPRRDPALSFVSRNHFLNIFFGRIRAMLER